MVVVTLQVFNVCDAYSLTRQCVIAVLVPNCVRALCTWFQLFVHAYLDQAAAYCFMPDLPLGV